MSVPNTFNLATGSIPLAQLDANFAYYDAAFSISGTTITFAGTMNGNLTGNVSGNAGTVTNGVYLASTQTLTNKTISGSSNTLSNIGNASLTNSAITINGSAISLGGTASVGTVTSVTGTSPVVSSGGATPAISMAAANTTTNGYLTSTDWNTFNNKQPAGTYVNSVSGTTGRTTSTGGATPAIDLASGVVTAGTTGSSTLIPIVTVDTYGRVTSLTTAANPQGTVTSVGGTGTVNGLTLTGTVTSTGNLTLGGTLDLSAPPAIGTTTPSTGAFTTLSASGNVTLGDASTDTLNVGNGGLVKDAAGNLGLGVTPSAWSGSGNIQGQNSFVWSSYDATLGANYVYNGGYKYIDSVRGASKYEPFNGAHKWYNAPSGTAGNAISFTQAMTLDASGNLLVGTTSTSVSGIGFAFQIQGASSTASQFVVGHASGAASGTGFGYFQYNGSAIGSITQTGTAAVLYNTTSDYRLKDVVGAVFGQGERIDALEPIEYIWKADGTHTRGFLAHKFQEVYAGSVNGTKDAVDEEGKPVYQSMQASSSEVIADLVAEIQSLRKRLAAAGI